MSDYIGAVSPSTKDRIGNALFVVAFFAIIFGPVAGIIVLDRLRWDATIACEQKRMQARPKPFSAQVACVPAYRATKSDTLTVNTPDLKEGK